MKLADLVVGIGANTKQLESGLGRAMREMKNFGKHTKQLGKNLTIGVTAPLGAFAAAAAKTAASFEFSMAKVQAVSGFAADEIKKLEEQAKELGGSTSKSASDVAGLQLELAKLGKTSGEIEAMTESILSLSIAFDTDLADASRVVGESLNQFNLDASESNRVADNMAVLFGSSALDLEKFGTAMSVVGPTASAMGLSIEQAGAALGTLVNAGVDASTAGTSLTKALTTLAAKGMTGDEALTSLFNGTLSVAEGFEIFGDRAGKIIPVLQKSTDAYTTLIQKQNEGTGAALRARKVLENTAQGGFDRLRSSVEALGIEFGNALLPMVNQLTNFISNLASSMSKMDDSTKTVLIVVGGLAAALGPILYILPQLAAGLKIARTAMLDFNLATLANPYVAAAAALGFLAYTVYQYTRSTTDANRAQKEFDASLKDAQKETARQMVKVDLLATAYNSANTSIEEKKEALEELKKISPEYFGNLDAEKTSYDDLKTAIDGYNKSLLKKATAAAMEKRLQAMAEERIDLMDAVISKESEVAKLREAAANGDKYAADSLRKIWNPALKQSQENLANHDKAMQEFADMMIQSVPAVEEETNAVTGNTKATKTNQQTREELLATMKAQLAEQRRVIDAEKEYRSLLREDILSGGPEDKGAKIDALPDELTGLETIPDMMDDFESDFIVDEIAFEKWQKWNNVMQGFKSVGESVFQSLAMNAASFGNEMGQAFGAMARGAEDGKERMKEATKGIINQALAAAQATIIEAMISSGKFSGPAAPIVIPALVAGGIGLVQSLFADIPAFADGGIISGPTVGLMGEYPGAKTNPEVIAPLDKLQSMLGAAPVVVTGKIAGNDIRLSNQRSERNAQRFLR